MSAKVQPFVTAIESFPIGRKLRKGDVLSLRTFINVKALTAVPVAGDTEKDTANRYKKLFEDGEAFRRESLHWSSYGVTRSDLYYVSRHHTEARIINQSRPGEQELFPHPVIVQEALLLKQIKEKKYSTDADGRITFTFPFDKKIQYGDNKWSSGAGFMVVHDRGTNDIWQVRFKMATGELKFNNDDNTYPEWKKYLHKWELA